jgi:DNA (cytosine-5)-methyltransferase 1
MNPRMLDLFCGAGGAAMGYARAGFEVVGVDIKPQPNYPFSFWQDDAIGYARDAGHLYDAIHASPPCQAHSMMRKGRWQDREHPDLVVETRGVLAATGRPYVIENVPTAPLVNPIMLCGSMFGLQTSGGNQLRRHRLFEIWPAFAGLVPECQHNDRHPIGVYGGGQHPDRREQWEGFGVRERRLAMGIDWMTGPELNQAIPPAYTQWVGEYLMAYMRAAA